MVVVAGDVAGIAVFDLARGVAEAIPDRLAPAVLVPRAFDLVRGAGGAPLEVLGKCQRCHARMVSTLRSAPKWKHCPIERQSPDLCHNRPTTPILDLRRHKLTDRPAASLLPLALWNVAQPKRGVGWHYGRRDRYPQHR